ncbi:hypothetical protein Dimus_004893 [Dionaea muscipula]
MDEDVWSVYRAWDNLICNEPSHKVSDDMGTDENENENEATESCDDRVEKPKKEMTFNTWEDAYLYYCKYAKQTGFVVTKRTSRKGKDEKLKDVTLSCIRNGKAKVNTNNPVKPRPRSRIGCPTHIGVVRRIDGKWSLSRVVLEHDHEPSPEKQGI